MNTNTIITEWQHKLTHYCEQRNSCMINAAAQFLCKYGCISFNVFGQFFAFWKRELSNQIKSNLFVTYPNCHKMAMADYDECESWRRDRPTERQTDKIAIASRLPGFATAALRGNKTKTGHQRRLTKCTYVGAPLSLSLERLSSGVHESSGPRHQQLRRSYC